MQITTPTMEPLLSSSIDIQVNTPTLPQGTQIKVIQDCLIHINIIKEGTLTCLILMVCSLFSSIPDRLPNMVKINGGSQYSIKILPGMVLFNNFKAILLLSILTLEIATMELMQRTDCPHNTIKILKVSKQMLLVTT